MTTRFPMITRFKVACVQNCAGPEIEPNLDETAALSRQAAGEGAELICLPEYFSCLDLKNNLILGQPFPEEPYDQLRLAICAVFRSWNGRRARDYRRHHHIADDHDYTERNDEYGAADDRDDDQRPSDDHDVGSSENTRYRNCRLD